MNSSSSNEAPAQQQGGINSDETTSNETAESNFSINRPPNNLASASFLSRLLFLWPYEVIRTGLDRPLQEADLPDVLPEDSSKYNLELMERIWRNEQERCQNVSRKGNKKRPSLHRALLMHYITTMWDTQVQIALVLGAQVVQAVALGFLIQTFSNSSGDTAQGYIFAGILVLCGLVILLTNHNLYFKTWRKGMQYRISAVAAIYSKSLRLPSVSGQAIPSGKIVNLATNDVERFLLACVMISYLFWGPVQALAVLGVGLKVIGPAFIAGYAVLLVIVVLQFYLGRRFAVLRSKVRLTEAFEFVMQQPLFVVSFY